MLHSYTFSFWFGMELCKFFPDGLWLRWLIDSPLQQRPCSVPGQPVQDWRWRKWHWDRVFSGCFKFSLSLSLHQHFLLIWGVIKTTVNGAAECNPTERQGSSIREAVCRTLVTVCDKFQLVRCSQSVVSYGWEKVCFEVCHKSWITNNALTWNFVSNCKEFAKETHEMLKLVYDDAAVTMKTVS